MKFFTLAVAVGLAMIKTNGAPSVDCGEARVPKSGKAICIEPNYIEGCESYLNEN